MKRRIPLVEVLITIASGIPFAVLYYVLGWGFGLASGLAYSDLDPIHVITVIKPPFLVSFLVGVGVLLVVCILTSLIYWVATGKRVIA